MGDGAANLQRKPVNFSYYSHFIAATTNVAAGI
jgi:hypothetical protein